MPCPICFEETDDKIDIIPGITLTECGHQFCKACIEGWILRLESASADPDPNCPECRCELSEEEIEAILGRPLRRMPGPSVKHDDNAAAETNGDDEGYFEPDEFTRAYLAELEADGVARRCPSCRAWIILEEGCNNIMCRCGCKFCFCCGQRGSCMGNTFYDNINEVEDPVFWMGRRDNVREEEMPCGIDPIFEGDLWYATEEDAGSTMIDPIFEGEIWMPIEIEAEDTLITPIFTEFYWDTPALVVPADPAIWRISCMWEEAMEQDYWDGDEGADIFGASLFT
mmetsp:Transcript_117569/g.175594  ORF Transcript_117569/g.175594 Transcript_117569/m.175594 type:complete len:284 (-) Transcript_117569:164-1015(-)